MEYKSIICVFRYISLHLYTQYEPEIRLDIYREVTNWINTSWHKNNMCSSFYNITSNVNKAPEIVSGEWGWSTCKLHNKPIPCIYKGILEAVTGANTDIDQAKFISRMYLMNIMSNVPFSVYYDLIDDGEHYGVIDVSDGIRPKLSYLAASTLKKLLGNGSYIKRLSSNIIKNIHHKPVNVCNAFGKHKKDCGYIGITKEECEGKRGCCFDKPHISGPQCYYSNGGNETIYILQFLVDNKVALAAWRNGTGKGVMNEENLLVQIEHDVDDRQITTSCYGVYNYIGENLPVVCGNNESLYLNVSDRPKFFISYTRTL